MLFYSYLLTESPTESSDIIILNCLGLLIHLITTLLQDQCEIEIKATTSNGYSSGSRFILSLYAEDHSRDPVELTKPHTSVTTGPFSRVPIKVKKADTTHIKYI